MATSVVQICNQALDLLGADPIADLEDPSKAAGLCKRNYPLARDAALRAYPWNCAVARAQLAALASAPLYGFTAAYQLPVNCLRVLDVDGDPSPGLRWRVEGNTLLADTTGALSIRYVRAIEDPARFDALLVQSSAARLAAVICFAVTGKDGLTERLLRVAAGAELEARRIDAREQSQDDEVVADAWSGARFTSYGGV